LIENPSAKAGDIAKLFKVSVQSVYQRKAKLKSAAPKSNWKAIVVSTSNKSVLNKIRPDLVNSPAHYTKGGIETIDFIEAKELDYHLGNVIKYISRANLKGNKLENLKKAKWYMDRAVQKTAT
jgi:hypothetical protein